MRVGIAVFTCVCACRFGFDDVEPKADAQLQADAAVPIPGVARVLVTGEEGEASAGQPIANAEVVVIEGDGTTRVATTDAAGRATVSIAGLSSIHVARHAPDLGARRWLLYSFTGLNGDVDLLAGGRPQPATGTRTMTVTLPAFTDAQITQSRVRGPLHCFTDQVGPSTGTTTVFTYSADCEGKMIPLVAEGLAYGEPWSSMDLGVHMLADGGAWTTPAAWINHVKMDMLYAGLPSQVTDVNTYVLMPLPGGPPEDPMLYDEGHDTVVAGSATTGIDVPTIVPGSRIASELVRVDTFSVTLESVDAPFGNRMFDNTKLPPVVTQPVIDQANARASWTST